MKLSKAVAWSVIVDQPNERVKVSVLGYWVSVNCMRNEGSDFCYRVRICGFQNCVMAGSLKNEEGESVCAWVRRGKEGERACRSTDTVRGIDGIF